jgi:predicted DNA-binding ribbon-helix-helix protein
MTLDSGLLEKRSMRIAGHRTSVALERPFWARLESMAKARSMSLPVLVALVDKERARHRPDASLASALRVEALLASDNGG